MHYELDAFGLATPSSTNPADRVGPINITMSSTSKTRTGFLYTCKMSLSSIRCLLALSRITGSIVST